MRPTKYLTGDDYEDLFLHNGKYWFCHNEGEIIIIPAVGDIVEYENGERNIICFYSSFDTNGDLALDVRMFDKLKTNINRRGRSNEALSVTPEAEDGAWPPEGCKMIRDGRVIYPISKCYYVINKSLLLKQSLKQKALELYKSASSKVSKALSVAGESFKKVKNILLSLPNMASQFWKAISDTFSKTLDMSRNMLKKIKNIFH
jgi:hypothetical protein